MSYKLAIIGSRDFNDYEAMKNCFIKFTEGIEISHITKMIFKADWDKDGRKAGIMRNKDIIENADIVMAFWDGKSLGTKNSIERAKKANKKLIVFKF